MTTFLAVIAVINALGLGGVVVKLFPPRLSGDERRDKLQRRVDELDEDVTGCHRVINAQADYIFELREHIASGKKPPPPPWPEGMKV